MMVLVTYDVNTQTAQGQKRLRHIAKICENFGQRVQNSVFECKVDPAQWVDLKHQLEKTIQPEYDSLRFYMLGANWKPRVEHIGAKPSYDPDGPLII
jgi:CRISPR-associated protein Cas2